MKSVYLHIGHPKCGSSSIQHFCERNRESLLQDGYFYPPTSGLTFHGEISPTFFKFAGLTGNLDQARQQLFVQIAEAPSEKVIISCEAFHQDDLQCFDFLEG